MRVVLLIVAIPWLGAGEPRGAALFRQHCAACHRAGSATRAPLPEALRRLSAGTILASLESGSMKAQAAGLSAGDRREIATYIGSRDAANGPSGLCPAASPRRVEAAHWNGWGAGPSNTRWQSAAMAGFSAAEVPRLKLRWAFGYAGASSALGQPSLVAGRLYVGSERGTVSALDPRSGCTYWTFQADAAVRTAITVAAATRAGSYSAYFGDTKANVYAVDAITGVLQWKLKVDPHPVARITGSPVLHSDRLFVPVSSIEEVSAANPGYPCCTFRGSVVAIFTETGTLAWKTFTIPEEPKPVRVSAAGTPLYGPAGGAVWLTPTLDPDRNVLYVGTGNAYSDPESPYTDAVLALDLASGARRWSRQLTAGDGWNFSCTQPDRTSCPQSAGPDADIGASPILHRFGDGRRLLLVGQKSGLVHALDPDRQGRIVWQTRIGRGGPLGGVQWGMAADSDHVYVALSDITPGKPETGGGMFALNIATGEQVWQTPAPRPACLGRPGCSAAQMGAVSVLPGVVFAGSMDGHLRGFSTQDGSLLWQFDTGREFQTVNGIPGRGGSLSGSGPVVAAGMLFVNSGYGLLGGMPGNLLLAFSPEL